MPELKAPTADQIHDIYRATFNHVCDPVDWKAPVDCVVPYDLANLYMQAIEFMTGVKPNAEVARHAVFGRAFRLYCVGYRAGPCGG